DGETLTGTLGANVKISIADGASVILKDVTINGVDKDFYSWAGITCEGNATIILEGSNSVTGFYQARPGIRVLPDKTLTITGTGELTASSNGLAAGIGGGYWGDCGNIVIDGVTITATGGKWSAGIGSGLYGDCGNITINSGTITAKKGEEAPYSIGIGAGSKNKCGTVTIGLIEGAISESPFTRQIKITDLSTIGAAYTAKDREILTGKLGANVKISIANGASVILKDVTINGVGKDFYPWAGLTCEGDATIILKGTNFIKGFSDVQPGIHIPEGKTLTINGDGALNASSNGRGAGIGGGAYVSCGNIVINGGTITATGGWNAAGIGGGFLRGCGNITITGGTINTAGGYHAAGIGSGHWGACGDITINDENNDVIITATKGEDAPHSIGAGNRGGCGKVTRFDLDGNKEEGQIDESPYMYGVGPHTKGYFTVDIKTAGAYNTNVVAFYGRKCLGLNEDGSYKLGAWEKLKNWEAIDDQFWGINVDNQNFKISRKYVELGFEFDIAWGTRWPYSNVFWKADKTMNQQVDNVLIEFGGTVRFSNILIKVNDKQEFYEGSCWSKSQYNWNGTAK
ncbi:MAG: hypothetical protein IJR85_05505, partial [Synergistaceae bacterium]|nr:hypothetical protein [Synergistaceae bacterium]